MLIYIQDTSQTFLCVFYVAVYINYISHRERSYDTCVYLIANVDIKKLKSSKKLINTNLLTEEEFSYIIFFK